MICVSGIGRASLLLILACLGGCQTVKKPEEWSLRRFEERLHGDQSADGEEPHFGLKGFTEGRIAEEETGIYLMEPFDPERIPVLFIHGLLSGPKTWRPVSLSLRGDPVIRKNFQFWYYGYPTGTPVVPAAAILKEHLDAAVATVERDFGISLHRRLVVVGHSMGGILAKSLVSSSGDRLWNAVFTAPLEEFVLTPAQRKLLREAFRYRARTYVGEAVFIASPQYGDNLADSLVGKLGGLLAGRPTAIEQLADALVQRNRQRLRPEFASFVANHVNSISTLRPDSPVTAVLAELPMDPAVTVHSIAGVKPGDLRGGRALGDGIVPLWSTRVRGLECEAGIASGHDVHHSPEAIDLLDLLLRRRAGLMNDRQMVRAMARMPLVFSRFKGKPVARERGAPGREREN